MKKLQGPITTKKKPRLLHCCEHLTNAQLAHIQYCDNVRSAWEALCGVREAKTIGDALLSSLLNPLEGPSVLNCENMELGGVPDFQH